jgi:hypothetical protein
MLPDDIIPEARPTLFVTNWSSRLLHGPGRRLSIMARPRAWEHGDGRVRGLMPTAVDLGLVRAGEITVAEYRRRFEAGLVARFLPPGELRFTPESDSALDLRAESLTQLVEDGDTLCCACSREAAARGECHRVWVAAALAAAGWRVLLDGAELVTP